MTRSAVQRKWTLGVLALVSVLVISAAAVARLSNVSDGPSGSGTDTTQVLLDGQPGAYIFSGAQLWTSPTDVVGVTGNNKLVRASAGGYTIQLASGPDAVLAPGSYESATRYPFSSGPGIDVSGNGRGCNTVSGRFRIQEVEFDTTGALTRLAATFEHHCEQGFATVYGEIRLRSSLPVAALTVTPATLAFSGPAAGQPEPPAKVTVRNVGTTEQTVVAALTGLDSRDFSLRGEGCTAPLAPAATCDITIDYRGTDTTAASATLRLTDGTARGSRTIPLSGPGLASAKVTLTVTQDRAGNDRAVALSAAVSPSAATGEVEFRDASGPIGRATVVDGVARLSLELPVGRHWITATYLGDTNHARRTSAPFRVIVEG